MNATRDDNEETSMVHSSGAGPASTADEQQIAAALCEHHSRARIVVAGVGPIAHRTADEPMPCGSCQAAARAAVTALSAPEQDGTQDDPVAEAWDSGHMLGETLAYNVASNLLWERHRETISRAEYRRLRSARVATMPHWDTNPHRTPSVATPQNAETVNEPPQDAEPAHMFATASVDSTTLDGLYDDLCTLQAQAADLAQKTADLMEKLRHYAPVRTTDAPTPRP